MAPTQTKSAAKAPAKRTARTHAPKTSTEYLQQAIADLDKARERAPGELRESLDAAVSRLRDAVGDLRKRAEQRTDEWQETLEQATEDARRELARRAIMVQRTPEALDELSRDIRVRKAELVGEPGPKA